VHMRKGLLFLDSDKFLVRNSKFYSLVEIMASRKRFGYAADTMQSVKVDSR